MQIELSRPFSSNSNVDEYDTRQIKAALNRLGFYEPNPKIGMNGIPDKNTIAGIKKFQKSVKLKETGMIKPGDETENAINNALQDAGHDQYIWRTVEDEKVRAGHAALNGEIRTFGQSPDPTEDFNCRCWAELISEPVIESEPLPPPNIPGTNIPDEGIAEGEMPIGKEKGWRYDIDPYLEKKPDLFDPGIFVPMDPYMPIIPAEPKDKEWPL